MESENEFLEEEEEGETRLGNSHPQTSRTTLLTIKDSISRLAEGEGMDKMTSLRVMHLFHEMEMLLTRECVKRDIEVLKSKSEAEKCRLEWELASYQSMTSAPPSTNGRKGRWGRDF